MINPHTGEGYWRPRAWADKELRRALTAIDPDTTQGRPHQLHRSLYGQCLRGGTSPRTCNHGDRGLRVDVHRTRPPARNGILGLRMGGRPDRDPGGVERRRKDWIAVIWHQSTSNLTSGYSAAYGRPLHASNTASRLDTGHFRSLGHFRLRRRLRS
jgi:hypothetical protein